MKDITDYTPEELSKADDLAAKAAQAYADFVYQKVFFEQLSKDYLASLKQEIREGNPEEEFSEAELETKARASEDWKAFRKEQFDLLKEAGRREIQYQNRLRRWQTIQSGLATKRAEISRFSPT